MSYNIFHWSTISLISDLSLEVALLNESGGGSVSPDQSAVQHIRVIVHEGGPLDLGRQGLVHVDQELHNNVIFV